jgi:hypothetical protein
MSSGTNDVDVIIGVDIGIKVTNYKGMKTNPRIKVLGRTKSAMGVTLILT